MRSSFSGSGREKDVLNNDLGPLANVTNNGKGNVVEIVDKRGKVVRRRRR